MAGRPLPERRAPASSLHRGCIAALRQTIARSADAKSCDENSGHPGERTCKLSMLEPESVPKPAGFSGNDDADADIITLEPALDHLQDKLNGFTRCRHMCLDVR